MASNIGTTSTPQDLPVESGFEILDTIRDASGLMGKISRRRRSGEITFVIVQEFTRHGEVCTTGFVAFSKAEAYQAMVVTVLRRCEELAKTLPVPAHRGKR